VLGTDPYVSEETDDTLLPLDAVLEKADILIIATPHAEYRELQTSKPVADVWNLLGQGVVI
jgi:UDP-N-acetyl-D-mannosaminuronic acid dehydrogenase